MDRRHDYFESSNLRDPLVEAASRLASVKLTPFVSIVHPLVVDLDRLAIAV